MDVCSLPAVCLAGAKLLGMLLNLNFASKFLLNTVRCLTNVKAQIKHIKSERAMFQSLLQNWRALTVIHSPNNLTKLLLLLLLKFLVCLPTNGLTVGYNILKIH